MSHQEILTKAIEKAMSGDYHIGIDGTVTNTRTGAVVKGSIDRKGYRYISIYLPEFKKSQKVKVHRLVALTFIPNPKGLPFINHIDGNPLNNDVTNLEWCTEQYNVIDGFNRGREVWNKGTVTKDHIMRLAHKYPRQIFWWLTKDNFRLARALWPTETSGSVDPRAVSPSTARPLIPTWQARLMEMVIADDPIEYLGEHL